MRNLQAKLTSFVKKHKTLSIILVLIVALCAWWAWSAFAPHPLGDKMEYLGKEDYGNIFGFDSAPNSVYYYGTDMSIGEVEQYFRGVEKGHSYQTNATVISFTHDKESFDIAYYQDKNNTSFNTNKKHVVSLLKEDYAPAKKALK